MQRIRTNCKTPYITCRLGIIKVDKDGFFGEAIEGNREEILELLISIGNVEIIDDDPQVEIKTTIENDVVFNTSTLTTESIKEPEKIVDIPIPTIDQSKKPTKSAIKVMNHDALVEELKKSNIAFSPDSTNGVLVRLLIDEYYPKGN